MSESSHRDRPWRPAAGTSAARPLTPRAERVLRLLPLARDLACDTSSAARRRLVRRVERALRAERTRGKAGHWTYDLARHSALRRLLDEERAALDEEGAGLRGQPGHGTVATTTDGTRGGAPRQGAGDGARPTAESDP